MDSQHAQPRYRRLHHCRSKVLSRSDSQERCRARGTVQLPIHISSSSKLDTDSETDSTAQGASQPPPSNQQLMSMSGRPPRRRCRDTITYVDGPDFRSEENDSYQPDTVRFPSGTLEPDETHSLRSRMRLSKPQHRRQENMRSFSVVGLACSQQPAHSSQEGGLRSLSTISRSSTVKTSAHSDRQGYSTLPMAT